MIVVHIGAKKAGSSSIQAFLSANEQALRQLSVEYPSVGRAGRTSHRNIAYELQNERRDRFTPHAGTLETVMEQWAKSTNRTLVLSSETFEECKPREIRRLREIATAGRAAEEFRIMFVIRDLIDLIPSIFDQQCRHGFTGQKFDEFFERIIRHPRIDFFAIAERWAQVFGWNAMFIRALDARNLVNGDLLDEVAAILQVDERDVRLTKTKSRNPSAGWKSIAAIQALFEGNHRLPLQHPLLAMQRPNEHDKSLGRAAVRVAAAHGWNKERGQYLTQEQAARCWQKFRVTVEKLNLRTRERIPLPLTLDERGFVQREFEPDVRYIPADELRTFYDALWLQQERYSRRSQG